LKQDRGFARIHRRVVEVQLRQGDRFLRVGEFRGYRTRKTYPRRSNSNVKKGSSGIITSKNGCS
jgi:hypothetical protein